MVGLHGVRAVQLQGFPALHYLVETVAGDLCFSLVDGDEGAALVRISFDAIASRHLYRYRPIGCIHF